MVSPALLSLEHEAVSEKTLAAESATNFGDQEFRNGRRIGVIYTNSMALYLGLGSVIALVGGPVLAYLALVPPLVGFGIFAGSLVLGTLAVLWGLFAQLRLPRKRSFWGVLFGLPAIALVGTQLILHRGTPKINDVSTDLRDPPILQQASKDPALANVDLSYPAEFRDLVRSHYSSLSPQYLQAPAPAVFEAAKSVIKGRENWKITQADPSGLTIDGTSKSALFGFVDDFAVRVRPTGEGALVDMRSRSRDGESDFGANSDRIRAFFGSLRLAVRKQ